MSVKDCLESTSGAGLEVKQASLCTWRGFRGEFDLILKQDHGGANADAQAGMFLGVVISVVVSRIVCSIAMIYMLSRFCGLLFVLSSQRPVVFPVAVCLR